MVGFRGSARNSFAYRSTFCFPDGIREPIDDLGDEALLLVDQLCDGLLHPEDRANAPARLSGG